MVDVPRAGVGEQLVAALHLVDRPAQRVRGLLHVGDDRQQHVRDAVERRELDHLRVDHQQAQLFGRALEQQRREHDVEADALAGAGRAGDDHVRHLARGRRRRLPAMSLPSTTGSGPVCFSTALVLDELAQVHGLALLVRQLEADAGLARDRRDDAHLLAASAHREIVGEAGDLGDLGAALRLELVHRDDRAGVDLVDAAAHAVGRELLDQSARRCP